MAGITILTMQQILHWPRAVIFVDMDAFFASIEQKDEPSLNLRWPRRSC